MNHLKTVAGIIYLIIFIFAGTFIYVILAEDVMLDRISSHFSVPEHFSGSEVLVREDTGSYVFVLREVVWAGLFHNGDHGFIEAKWTFSGKKMSIYKEKIILPEGRLLGEISIDPETERVDFIAADSSVLGLMDSTNLCGHKFKCSRKNKRSLLNQDNWYAVRILVDRNKW